MRFERRASNDALERCARTTRLERRASNVALERCIVVTFAPPREGLDGGS
jgi:hypothetical protein